MKKLFVFVFLMAGIMMAFAEPVRDPATMKLTFGWLRGPDGTARSVQGVELEVGQVIKLDPSQVMHVRPMKAKKGATLPKLPPPGKNSKNASDLVSLAEALVGKNLSASTKPGGMFEQVVFSSRTGNYYILDVEFADPSTLDDIVMSGGTGKLWNAIWVGIHINDTHEFLIRWQIFDNTSPNQNHNQSAFQNILGPNNIMGEPAGDFGGILNPANWPEYVGPGSYLVRIELPAPSILWPGITCPDNTIWMGQQFREPQPNGEGAFDTSFKTVYTADIPVALGTSQDGFWYDFDDLNGIYSADEFELLGSIDGQPQPFNNVCREIITSGSSANFGPLSASVNPGVLVSGDTFSLQDSDNEYLIFKPFWAGSRTDPHAIVTMEGTAPVTNITGMRFSVETGASLAGGTLRIELYNWNSQSFVLPSTHPIPSTDGNFEVTVPSNFTQYVRSNDRRVRARVLYFAPGTVDRQYAMRIDRAQWMVTYP